MKDLLNRRLFGRGLFERRRDLQGSIPVAMKERRLESRLEATEPFLSPYSKKGYLQNLSESGLAVEIPQRCRFARGESHRLRLRVGLGSVEVDGTVRWTRSIWRAIGVEEVARYNQVAGFEILGSVPEETLSILGIMRGMVRDSRVTVEVSESLILDGAASKRRSASPVEN